MRCGWGGDPPCAVRLDRRGLCAKHRAVIRATEAAGPNDETAADARALALEVLRAGELTRTVAAEKLSFDAPRLGRAVAAAERLDWIAAGPRALTPGDVVPPGRIKREIRAAMLTRFVRAQAPRTVTFEEAAAAIGLSKGAVPRVAAYARAQGWITTHAGGNGGIAAV